MDSGFYCAANVHSNAYYSAFLSLQKVQRISLDDRPGKLCYGYESEITFLCNNPCILQYSCTVALLY